MLILVGLTIRFFELLFNECFYSCFVFRYLLEFVRLRLTVQYLLWTATISETYLKSMYFMQSVLNKSKLSQLICDAYFYINISFSLAPRYVLAVGYRFEIKLECLVHNQIFKIK